MRNKRRASPEFETKSIKALNERQATVLKSDKNLVLVGYAGTGKTYLATYLGLNSIDSRKYDKLIYLRSAVPTRNIGFLPGTDKEKVEVYEGPYSDIVAEIMGRGDAYDILKKKGIIEFKSTSFVRGINLQNAFIVVDECQNMTYHELDSIITRLKDNCRIAFCGDIRQADLYKNGLEDFYNVLQKMGEFDFIEFQKEDIVRSPLVKNYILTKERVLGKL